MVIKVPRIPNHGDYKSVGRGRSKRLSLCNGGSLGRNRAMDGKLVLALDQGTTSSRTVAFDRDGRVVAMAQREFAQHYPRPGWVEHEAGEIWETQLATLEEVVAKVGRERVVAIGITNQRETTVVWDRATGQPVHRAIVWQDRRTAGKCAELKAKAGVEEMVRGKTGLRLDPYFSGTKLGWLLESEAGLAERAREGDLCFGTVDAWLIWKLTGGAHHATDASNASRTLLYDIHEGRWDQELLETFGVCEAMLPEVRDSIADFGMWEGIPICGVAGDQQAALFGQGCFESGDTKCTYGTGSFLLTNTGNNRVNSSSGMLSTIVCNKDGKPVYGLEGSVFIGGAVIQWLRDELQLLSQTSDSEEMALAVEDSNGVVIVPAFTGLGAPYWDMDARGIITGLTRGANRNHIVRAALECIAYQVNDLVEAVFSDLDLTANSLQVDGGATANNFLMQFQADLLRLKIDRPKNVIAF